MELFYALPDNISTNEIFLDDFEKNHLLKTLRKKTGDEFIVTDGMGNLYNTVIDEIKPVLKLRIISNNSAAVKNQPIALAVGFIRLNRLEFIIEKGTELGVDEFILFKSQFCNHFSTNLKRFEKILRQAMKQSLQLFLPKIIILDSFSEFIDFSKKYKYKIAGFTEKDKPITDHLNTSDKFDDPIVFTVGPEGGFSEDEGRLLRENNFKLVSLGKTRLRTETAAIGGTAAIQFHRNT